MQINSTTYNPMLNNTFNSSNDDSPKDIDGNENQIDNEIQSLEQKNQV